MKTVKYPAVMSESATVDAIVNGRSIARYGDGELRVALGRKCVSQEADPKLAEELRAILRDPADNCLVGIPNVNSATPKRASWDRFARSGYTGMYKQKGYASSFITRPDSAPWIDTPEYWSRVVDIWRDRDITLVVGDQRSLRATEMPEARSITIVDAPRRDAWRVVDQLQEKIGRPSGPILMCLGCTATALAKRLERSGLWGIDLGHIGMFMRHAGLYHFQIDQLASKKYRRVLQQVHNTSEWGTRGDRHAPKVNELIDRLAGGGDRDKISVLDYGCGQGSLAKALKPHRCQQYDPGIPGLDVLPKPSDLVVCTDVLEHVEPKQLQCVLDHLFRLTGAICYLAIATRPANQLLPSGKNSHLIIQHADWWRQRLWREGWLIESSEDRSGKELIVTLVKQR